MRRDTIFWSVFASAAATLFYTADVQGWPACGVVRRALRMHDRRGRALCWGLLGGGTVVLGRHLTSPFR